MKNRGISFWHLVRNLTNNYLLKKLLKWPNKKCKNFNIYNVVFILKNEENHLEISLFYTCVPQILMIWSTFPEIWSMTDWNWQFWVVFCPFTTPEISEFWKNKKKTARDVVLHMCTKITIMFSEIQRWKEFFIILGHFLPFNPPQKAWKLKFWKIETSTWRYHHFTQVYQKLQSYDECFLTYQVWQTIFCHFVNFWPFFALTAKQSRHWFIDFGQMQFGWQNGRFV